MPHHKGQVAAGAAGRADRCCCAPAKADPAPAAPPRSTSRGEHAAKPLPFKQRALRHDGHGRVIEGQGLHLFASDPLVLGNQQRRGMVAKPANSCTDSVAASFTASFTMDCAICPPRSLGLLLLRAEWPEPPDWPAESISDPSPPQRRRHHRVRPMRGSRDAGSTPIRVSRLGIPRHVQRRARPPAPADGEIFATEQGRISSSFRVTTVPGGLPLRTASAR